MASFMDGVSPTPVFIARYNQIYYSGSVGINKSIPVAGHTTLGLHATSWGEGITQVWRPKVTMPKRWSYQMSATIPFLQMDVSAKAVVNTPGTGSIPVALEGTQGALGDVVIQPLMLNYNISPSLNMNFRVSFYLPRASTSTRLTPRHNTSQARSFIWMEHLPSIFRSGKVSRESECRPSITNRSQETAAPAQTLVGSRGPLRGSVPLSLM